MGVGFTLIAALMQGRRAMGCEREITYVELDASERRATLNT